MLLYHYDEMTGELLDIGEARLDPRTKEARIPAFATDIAPPPEIPAHHAPVFRDGAWALEKNHRGETWWKPDTEVGFVAVLIDFLGDPADAGLTNVAPADHRKEIWWDGDGHSVEIDFFGDPADRGLTNVEPPAPPAYATATAAKVAMVAWIDDFTRQITGPVPRAEEQSWPLKGPAAMAYKAGVADAEQIAILTAEAEITGETLEELVGRIEAKVKTTADQPYTIIAAKIAGLRRKTSATLDAVTDPHDYEAVLIAAKTDAAAMAAAMGIAIE